MNLLEKPKRLLNGLAFLVLVLLLLRSCGGGKEENGRERPPEGGTVSTPAAFDRVLAEHAARLDGQFRIPCTPSLHALLEEPSAARPGSDLLAEIRSMNGFHGCTMGWIGDTLAFDAVSYYAGWRILCAVRNGREEGLDARERATLRAARNLVAGARGSPAEKERYIHDALCGRITYYTNGAGQEDKDCAVGALLDGLADCDGYADAMVLCCGLAGIPCRYMHGNARDPGEIAASRISEDAGHMWNLVEIAGSWVTVDATWDDQENRISYLSYNLGRKDAALAYRWDPRALFVELAEETDGTRQLMPDQRRTAVHSPEEVYRAAREATVRGARRFTFVAPGAPPWQAEKTAFHRMLARGGWKSYRHVQGGRMLEVTEIQTDAPIRFCDTEGEALDAIRGFAEAGGGSFSLYFRPGLADALLADGCAGLERLLSRSRLAEPGTFRYSGESGSVRLTDAAFAPVPPLCRSEGEIRSLLRRKLAGKPTAVAFLLPEEFDFGSVRRRVADCIHSMGVASYAWSRTGDRVRLLDLEYHGEFRLVDTREEAAAYLRSAHGSGKRVVRIFCPPDLYSRLAADHARAFRAMLEDAGFKGGTVYSNDGAGMLSAEW